MIRVLSTLLMLVLLATMSLAEVQTVHIQNGNYQGSGVLCGGTSNGSHRVILSVAHVCGTEPGSTMTVTANGRKYRAWLIGADRATDSALLVIVGRYLEKVPSARLWLGNIDTDQDTITEGYTGGTLVRSVGQPRLGGQGQLLWTAASYPGMSGGPQYLLGTDPPAFLTTTSRSDHRTRSTGPDSTFFVNWLPELETKNFRFVCSSQGFIQMQPRRGRLRGPIAIPEAPPAQTAAANHRPPAEFTQSEVEEPTPEPDMEALKKELTAELQKLLTVTPPSKPQPVRVPTIQVEAVQPAQSVPDGEIITLSVPIKIRVKSQHNVNLEVVE